MEKKVFAREDMVTKNGEANRKTSGRIGNLTNNINNVLKARQMKFINNNDLLLPHLEKNSD